MVNFALQTRKTSQNHDFFMKKQAKSLFFHVFPRQNFPAVNPSSRHAYRGSNLVIEWLNIMLIYTIYQCDNTP